MQCILASGVALPQTRELNMFKLDFMLRLARSIPKIQGSKSSINSQTHETTFCDIYLPNCYETVVNEIGFMRGNQGEIQIWSVAL